MAKDILFGDEARVKMVKGLNVVANAVKATLGPKGRLVVFKKSTTGLFATTKDGVTVAKQVDLMDEFENAGAQIMKQVANKTVDQAGDGTTTSCVLAQAIVNEGMKMMAAGHDPTNLKKGVDLAVKEVIRYVESVSTPVNTSDDVKAVGTISANGDAVIGQLLADGLDKIGNDGLLLLEEGGGLETTLEVVQGYFFDRGYLSQYFSTNVEKLEAVYNDINVLITDKEINNQSAMLAFLQRYTKSGPTAPLLIVADNVTGDALSLLVFNRIKGGLPVVAVRAPGFGNRRKEMLQDLAILTGATVVSEDMGLRLEDCEMDVLGKAKKVIVNGNNTTVMEGLGDEDSITERVAQLRSTIASETEAHTRKQLQERLAKLASGIGIIKVGGSSDLEIGERKDRIDDALHATKAAIKGGVVPGSGVVFLRAMKVLDSLQVPIELSFGVSIVKNALKAPATQILLNAGEDPSVIINSVLSNDNLNWGYNSSTGEFQDLVSVGVLDPALVLTTSLTNAASVASLLITTEVIIVPSKEDIQ